MLDDQLQPTRHNEERRREMAPADEMRSDTDSLGGIRRLKSSDLPELCEIFSRTFPAGRRVDQNELADAFQQVYLTSPLDVVRPASLVDVGPTGRIDGFMGIVTLSARLDDSPLRVGVLGNFMAADNADRTHTAMRLVRATVAHDLDLIVSDTANHTSTSIARCLKFEYLSSHSIEWIKILRPAGTLQCFVERQRPRLARTLAPMARIADLFGQRLPFTALPEFEADRYSDNAIESNAFLERSPALTRRFRLRPAWNEPEFSWLLDQARQRTRNGPLQIREVTDRGGRTVGLYLLHARSGSVAWALQILARRGQEHIVLAALIRRAAEVGAVAVRGNTNPDILAGLSMHVGVVFRQVAGCVAFSRDPEVRAAVRSGDLMVGGLLGESWTRFVAAEFTRTA